jgi:hypothetical protein
MDIFWDKKE